MDQTDFLGGIPHGYCYEGISFPSVTGLSDIYAKSWAPSEEREVTAVIQILHGMAEHIARYDAFASYLCGQGFAVFANDHVGHGKSAKSDEETGRILA